MRLSVLAERLGLGLEGDGDVEVTAAAPLDAAGPQDLAFATGPRWADALAASKAGALVLPPDMDAGGRPALRSPLPRRDFARATGLLHPPVSPAPGVHPGASVEPDADVHPEASVGARAVVGAASRVGARSVVHAGVVIYPRVEIGVDCVIHAGCVLREDTRIGDRVTLHPGVLLGGDGFGYEPGDDGSWEKVPQVGRVEIADDVEIGAGTTVDRAALGVTRIASGVKIDNLVQVAHNCDIGEDSLIIAQSGLGGSTHLGRRVILMARTGIAGHLSMGDGSFAGVRSGVVRDVPPGGRVFGSPAAPERVWHRGVAAMTRLPAALKRLRRLEKRVDRLDPPDEDA